MSSIQLSGALEKLSSTTLDELVDNAVMGVIFEVHRAHHLGFLRCEDGDNPDYPAPPSLQPEFKQVEVNECSRGRRCKCPDVLGNTSENIEIPFVQCSLCSKQVLATRFSLHFSKCSERHEEKETAMKSRKAKKQKKN